MQYDDLKLMVETMSGGKNTVILDDMGQPSMMVKIPKMTYAEMGIGASDAVFPAFIVGEKILDAIYISKFQNIVENDRAYSLPNKDPRTYVTFDQARTYCKNKGAGWHMLTMPERALIAWWSKKNGTMPRGNNNYGKDIVNAHEKGHETYKADATRTGRVAGGSGPASWSHDWTNDGIFDLNGNVGEWCDGFKIVDGVAQVMRNNNFEDLESAWLNTGVNITTGMTSGNRWLTHRAGDIANAPGQLWESLAIPATTSAAGSADFGTDGFWFDATGERLPLIGGGWSDGSNAGVFALLLSNLRSNSNLTVGFRSAYAFL